MPFDPSKPASNSPNSSAEMRAQLNALNDAIAAIPAGPPGPAGPQVPAFSSVQIGSVTTGSPGSPAGVVVSVFGNNVELSFTIPAGESGAPGEVSSATLAGEIAGTARNPSSVSPLAASISDPPTHADVQMLMDKINELTAATVR